MTSIKAHVPETPCVKRVILLSFIMTIFSIYSYAQTSMLNKGTLIMIQEDATLYVSGDYTDNSNMASAGMFLAGEFWLLGDFINNRQINSYYGNILSDDGNGGTLILSGDGDQLITGSPVINNDPVTVDGETLEVGGTSLTLLRQVVIDKETGGSVSLGTDVQILERFHVESGSLDLMNFDMLVSDIVVRDGTGDTKYPYVQEELLENDLITSSGTGAIVSSRAFYDQNIPTNHAGIGVDLTFNENPTTFEIRRTHSSITSVADGASVNRAYEFYYTGVTGSDTDGSETSDIIKLSQIDILYADVELNSITENSLGIYIRAGTEAWRELTDIGFSITSASAVTNTMTISNSTFDIEKNITYTIALANKTCAFNNTDYNFDTNGFRTATIIDGGILNVCEDENVALIEVTETGFTDEYPSFSYWTGEYISQSNSIEIHGSGIDIESGMNKTFDVKAINSFGCDTDISFIVNERQNPNADFDNPGTICDGMEVTFDNTSTESTNTINDDFETITYSWDFDDGSAISTNKDPMHIFPDFDLASSVGNLYGVTLEVLSSYGCIDAKNLNVRIMPNPILDFSFSDPIVNTDITDVTAPGNNYICEHDEVEFGVVLGNEIFNTTPIYGSDRIFHWTIEEVDLTSEVAVINDITDLDQTKSYIYNTPGNDNEVGLTVEFSATGCSTTMPIQSIPVKPRPDASFLPKLDNTLDRDICVAQTLDMDNSSTLAVISGDVESPIYAWGFGDIGAASTSNLENPTKFYTAKSGMNKNDKYEVSLTVTSDTYGCFHTVTDDILVYPIPEGGFIQVDDLDCEDQGVEFENLSYIQDFEDDLNSGIYQSNLSFTWKFGDLTEETNKTKGENWEKVFHIYDDPGIKTVTLVRESDYGCVNQDTEIIEIYSKPQTVFTVEAACVGEPFLAGYAATLLPGYDEISMFDWTVTGHDPAIFDTDTVSLTYYENGSYQVDLKATTLAGCDSTYSANIVVSPHLIFGLETIVSCDEEITIDPTLAKYKDDVSKYYLPDGTTYQWYNQEGVLLNSDFSIPQLTGVTASGAYTVVLGNSDGISCGNSVTVNVEAVNASVEFSEIDGVIFCQEGVINSVIRTNLAGINDTYVWKDMNDDIIVGESEASLFVNESGTYTVEVNSLFEGITCFSEATINVVIEEPLDLIFDDISVCIGEDATLDADVTGALYVWTKLSEEAGGIDEQISENQTVKVTEPAKYRVDVSKGACSSSGIVEVINYKEPQVSFSTNAINFCKDTEIAFRSLAIPVESGTTLIGYEWDFDDGTVINAINPQHTFTSAGYYDVTLTVETSNNCVFDYKETITIYTLPDATFIPPSYCQNVSAEFTGNLGMGMTNNWNFGDGLFDEGSSVFHQYELSKDYDVVLTVESTEGCISSSTETIEIYEIPKYDTGGSIVTCGSEIELDASAAGIIFSWVDDLDEEIATNSSNIFDENGTYGVTIENANGCVINESFDITLNTAIVPDLGSDRDVCGDFELSPGFFPGATYAWSTGVNTQSIQITEPGTYQVDIIDANGCVGSDEVVIGYLDEPVVELGASIAVCEGEKVILHAGNTGSSFLWSTGVTTQSIQTYEGGDYWVEVTNAGGCMTRESVSIILNPIPEVDFSFVENCRDEDVYFLNASVIDSSEPLTYEWTFGDGTSSDVLDPIKVYSNADNYDITLFAQSQSGCEMEVSKEITIHPYPTANFLVKDLCEDEIYQLTNLSSITDDSELFYDWTLSSGSISSESNPSISYTIADSYDIELEVTSDFGCSSSVIKSTEVFDLPMLIWPETVETCDEVITLNANNTGNTFLWSTFETTQTIDVHDSGEYEVLVTNANNCSISESITAQFYTVDNPTLGDDFAHCGATEISTYVENVSYQWSTNETTQSIFIDETGGYTLTVTNDELCSSTDEIQVTINEIPDSDMPVRINACQSELPQLDATTDNVVSYLWSTGANTSVIEISETGDYTVLLTSTEGCEKTEIVVVDILDSPIIEIQDLEKGCDELILDAGTFGESMVWSNGGEDFYNTFTESGIYTLTVSLSNECSTFKEFEVTINDSPEVDLGDDTEICFGETITIYAGEEDVNAYLWTDLSTNNTLTVGSDGTYVVEVTNEFECSTVDGVTIDVRPEIEIELGEDRFICDNNDQDLVLDAGIDSLEYHWTSSYGETSSEKSFTPESFGTFSLTVFDSLGCYAMDEVTLAETSENITASFLSASIADIGDTIQFAQLTEAVEATYVWFFGDGSRSLQESPEHIYLRDGEFEVMMIASNGVCTDTLQKVITVIEGRIEGDENTYEALYTQINELNLYPNPTREYINIYFELNKEEDVYLQINDMSGIVHHRSRVNIFESTVQIKVSELPSGMYFLTTVVGSTTKRIKFLVN